MWNGQEPLDQHQPSVEVLWVHHLKMGRVIRVVFEGERRVPVGRERPREVEAGSLAPPRNADVEVEQRSRVGTREENGEEGADPGEEQTHSQQSQQHNLGDSQQPFNDPQPP